MNNRNRVAVGLLAAGLFTTAASYQAAEATPDPYSGDNPFIYYGDAIASGLEKIDPTGPIGDNRVTWGNEPGESPAPMPSPSPTIKKQKKAQPSPTPSPSPSPIETNPETNPDACVARLPLEFKVGQVVVVGINPDQMAAAASVYDKRHIGGLLLMDAASADQIKDFQKRQQVRTLVSVDVEGGIVDRYRNQGMGFLASQRAAANLGPTIASGVIKYRGDKLRDIGIDQIYGPVVDIDHGDNALESRIFSSDADKVKKMSVAYAKAWLESKGKRKTGLIPTPKHWPGGVGTTNTDHGVSETLPFAELGPDMEIYDAMPKGTAVMASNTIVADMTNGMPASLSRNAITNVLRGQHGFDGLEDLVVTDDLNNAVAIKQSVEGGMSTERAAELAIHAGVDQVVIVANDSSYKIRVNKVTQRLLNAVEKNEIDVSQLNKSVRRVLHAKGVNPCDILELELANR